MEKELWELIERTKKGKEFVSSELQFQNLENELNNMKKSDVEVVYHQWRGKINTLTGNNPEFEKLHEQDGGIVSGGDDAFYMDFANWLVSQGEELYNKFESEGHQAVLDYIEKHDISADDYLFECMIYAFQGELDY